MKPRAKTLIERFGFCDRDRERVTHDQIQIWVYQNFGAIIGRTFPALVVTQNFLWRPKLEFPIPDKNHRSNFIIGFVDVYSEDYSIGVEIKTYIPYVGELIRQIQFYRQYLNASWIVVSPDDRFSDILKEQGINFYKYATGNLNTNQFKLFQ